MTRVVGTIGSVMDEKTHEVARLWVLAQPTVSAFIASLVRDFRDRDDVLQDVAVAVIDSFRSYDPSRPFVAWAIGIARNEVRHHLRRKGAIGSSSTPTPSIGSSGHSPAFGPRRSAGWTTWTIACGRWTAGRGSSANCGTVTT